MTKKIDVDPFNLDDIEGGLYLGDPNDKGDIVIDFNLRAAADYVEKNNLNGITDEVRRMFKI